MTDPHQLHQNPSESFFMTDCLEPKLRHQSSKQTLESSYVNIQNLLQATQQMLANRRQKAIMHNQRIKELQSEFQRKQASRQKSLEQKLQNSQQLKYKCINSIQQRLRKISERRNQVGMQIKQKEQEDTKRQLEMRKSYEPESTYSRINSSQTSKASYSEQRIQLKVKQIRQAQDQIQHKLEDYHDKQEHAKDISLIYHQEKAIRANSHNSIQVPEISQRASFFKAEKLRAQSQEAIARISSLSTVRNKREKLIQQKHQRKRKHNSEMFQRIHNNLEEIDQRRQLRCAELDQKYERVVSKNYWKDPRETGRNKRLLDNLTAIEKTQKLKAERVIEKHKEIAERTRMFRERRQDLYKNYKNQTIA